MKLDIPAAKAFYKEHRASQPTYKERLVDIKKRQAEKELLKIERPKKVTVLCAILTGCLVLAFSWLGLLVGWLITAIVFSRYKL